MEICRTPWLPLVDPVVVVREFLNPKVSRSGLARCLKRHSLNRRPVEVSPPARARLHLATTLSTASAPSSASNLVGIEPCLIKPRPPQTHGRGERGNGCISDLLATPRFRSREELQTTLERYERLYNEHLPQRALSATKHPGKRSVPGTKSDLNS